MNKEHIVITGMARTPMGSFQGCLSTEKAPDLGSIAIKGAIKKANIKPAKIKAANTKSVLSQPNSTREYLVNTGDTK